MLRPGRADPAACTRSGAHGARFTAGELLAGRERLARLVALAAAALAGFDALLTPARRRHRTLAEVVADPVGVNSRPGRYIDFADLLDLASVAIPAGRCAGCQPRAPARRASA